MEIEQEVRILQALADPTRLQIVRFLRDKGCELSCGEIGSHIQIPKSTASYHFRTLREAGLTTTRKEALNRFICLRTETFEALLPGFLESL
ncbi:MAG: metalloregulator ArsR/SmtB family transcription factor [Ethanoligenens sp.]